MIKFLRRLITGNCLTILAIFLLLMLTTVAGAMPTVTFTDPTNGASGVSANTNIQATFSDAMDPSVINAQTFSVHRHVKVKAVAAGRYHNVVLKTDGTVAVWGYDLTSINSSNYGQMDVPAGLTGVTAVAAGAYHCVALKNDGTVTAWGMNNYGQANPPAGLTGIISVSAGWYHTVALKGDGTVVAWGLNNYGQTNIPPGLTGVKAIAAGGYFTLALKSDGTVVGWGDNGWYQTKVPAGLSGVVAIAAGWNYSLALKCDGTVVAWGGDNYGQSSVPAGITDVIAIAATPEGYHSVALKKDGTVVAWGRSIEGQCTAPAGLSGVTAIAAGGYHTLALKNDCTLVAWGDNSFAQSTVPVESSEINTISEGGFQTLALKQDGTVVGWGNNVIWPGSSVPAGISGVTSIAAAGTHALALKSDGTVVAWGDNSSGQSTVPTGLSGVMAIASGDLFSVALKSDGTVVAWGDNSYGQCNVPAGLSGVTAIASGEFYTLALKKDGTVVAWGLNQSGETTVPPALSGVVAVAAGGRHALALKNDGTVVAWGDNSFGQSTVPAGLTGVTEIAAGTVFSVALKNDGTVVTWGSNPVGSSIPFPAGLSGVSKISARNNTIAVLKANGGMVVWGNRDYAQAPAPYLYRFGNIYESQIGGSISYDPVMNTATFTPFSSLEPGIYTVDIATIRNAAGEMLATPAEWTFTTDNYDSTTSCPCSEPAFYSCSGPATYKVTGTVAGGNGTISCVSPVNSGTTSTCAVTPAEGYQLLKLTDNSADVTGQVSNTTYAIINVSEDHAVAATFGDTVPPIVTPPPNIIIEATGPTTQVNIGTAAATDAVGVVSLTSNAPTSFLVGTTTVTWTAEDASGNSGTATQSVTVKDTTPPGLDGLVNQILEATSPSGAMATFKVTARDLVDPAPQITCTSASGSILALGVTTVTCTAKDLHNNSATGSFTITVRDATPPTLNVPANISVLLNTPLNAPTVQTFLNGATATDIVDLSVTIASTTPLLTTVGPKAVAFTAIDDFGNMTTRTAIINVIYGCGSKFEPPVSLLKPFKLGSTIPVKFSLCDVNGTDVLTASARLYLQLYSGTTPGAAPIEVTSTIGAETGSKFKVLENKYMYNLPTKNLSPGDYQIQAVLDDGTVHTIPLTLKP
jgi:alpha-tubulin suppressor-like RCC1 family protein